MAAPKRILVVEDDPALAELFKQGVAIEGSHELIVVETAEEALQRFQENTFDLAIVDYKLPKMNGLELIAAIRELDTATQCIIVSGYRDDEMDRAAQALDVFAVFSKPFYIMDFRESVNKALTEPRRVVKPPPGPAAQTGRRPAPPVAPPRGSAAKPVDIGRSLDDLARELNAVCALLTDSQGGLALHRGTLNERQARRLAELTWRSFMQSEEIGSLLGEAGRPQQILQEGEGYHVCSFGVGDGRILAVAYAATTPIGIVRYRTRQVVQLIQRSP